MAHRKSATNDPCDWWFYFEKINEGEMARCKNCNWEKPRGKDKSTRVLKYHLEHQHPLLFSQRLEAIRQMEKNSKKKSDNTKIMTSFFKTTDFPTEKQPRQETEDGQLVPLKRKN